MLSTSILPENIHTMGAVDIEKLALESPDQTTRVAHVFTEDELTAFTRSTNMVERLFGYLCFFARGNVSGSEEFANCLTNYIQMKSALPNHSKLCAYFYDRALSYLPGKLPACESRAAAHKASILRHEKCMKLPANAVWQLEALTYEWLGELNRNYYASQDTQTLLGILSQLEKLNTYNPSLDLMIGCVLSNHNNFISPEIHTQVRERISTLRLQKPGNLSEAVCFLLHENTFLKDTWRLDSPYSREHTSSFFNMKNRIGLPNIAADDIAAQIEKNPSLLISAWLKLEEHFQFENLNLLLLRYEKLRNTLTASQDPEIKAMLALAQFMQQYPKVMNAGLLKQTMRQCPNRLRKLALYAYAGGCLYGVPYDPELHPMMLAAVKRYPEDPRFKSTVEGIQRLQPGYIEQMTDGVVRASATAGTTFMSYARPLAASVSDYSGRMYSNVRERLAEQVETWSRNKKP